MSTEMTRPLAVVTGASSGIGLELARQFVQHGYDVVGVADQAEQLDQATRTLSAIDPDARVESVVADLSTSEGVETLYASLAQLDHGVDVLAANAGIGVSGDFARETSLDDELRLIHLNVTSQVHLIKLILSEMIERDSGRILITSSIASLTPGPYYATYAASKAFLRSFGEALRYELKDTGIGVTVLMPGPTDTQFFDRAGMQDTKAAEGPKQDPAEVAREAFDALEKDKPRVVTGAKNKLQAAASKVTPTQAGAAMQAKQTKPQQTDRPKRH